MLRLAENAMKDGGALKGNIQRGRAGVLMKVVRRDGLDDRQSYDVLSRSWGWPALNRQIVGISHPGAI